MLSSGQTTTIAVVGEGDNERQESGQQSEHRFIGRFGRKIQKFWKESGLENSESD